MRLAKLGKGDQLRFTVQNGGDTLTKHGEISRTEYVTNGFNQPAEWRAYLSDVSYRVRETFDGDRAVDRLTDSTWEFVGKVINLIQVPNFPYFQ